MQLLIDKTCLRDALTPLMIITGRRKLPGDQTNDAKPLIRTTDPKQQIRCVVPKPFAGIIRFLANNGSVQVESSVKSVPEGEPGAVAFQSDRLMAVVSRWRGEHVRITTGERQAKDQPQEGEPIVNTFATFEGQHERFEVETHPSKLIARFSKGEPSGTYQLSAGEFKHAFGAVVNAADPKEGAQTYAMSGVLVQPLSAGLGTPPGQLLAVATRGPYLCAHVFNVESDDGVLPDPERSGRVIPLAAVKLALRLAGNCGDDARAWFGFHLSKEGAGEAWSFHVEGAACDWTLTSRMMEGRYPRWENGIPPGEPTVTIRMGEPRELARIVELAAVVADKDGPGGSVEMEIDTEAFRITPWGQSQHGYGQGYFESVMEGASTRFSVWPAYFLDALRHAPVGQDLLMHVMGPNKSIVLRSEDNRYLSLVAPTTTGREPRRCEPGILPADYLPPVEEPAETAPDGPSEVEGEVVADPTPESGVVNTSLYGDDATPKKRSRKKKAATEEVQTIPMVRPVDSPESDATDARKRRAKRASKPDPTLPPIPTAPAVADKAPTADEDDLG